MSEEFNSLTIAVLRNKVYDLKKSREENLKKLKELQNKTNSLSQKINEITDKIQKVQSSLQEKVEAENIKTVKQLLTSTASIPNRSVHIGFFRIKLKSVIPEEEIFKILSPIFNEDWNNTDKKQIIETTTYCPYPDYWEDDTKNIDFFISKKNPKTKEIIHINWYANYTKNKSNFEIRDSKLKLNHVFQLIKILQTNPNIQDFKLEDYPNLMSVIVEKINQ